MSDITNAQAVSFCNNKVRSMADSMSQNYYTAKALVNEWNATGMSAIITNDTSNVVDGSANDGRNPITGAMATNIIVRATEIITDYEAAANAKLNTVISVKVNGGAKF